MLRFIGAGGAVLLKNWAGLLKKLGVEVGEDERYFYLAETCYERQRLAHRPLPPQPPKTGDYGGSGLCSSL